MKIQHLSNTTASTAGGSSTCSRRRLTRRLLASPARAFNLTAQPAYITQPDGQAVYSWGYGCNSASDAALRPQLLHGTCATMQVPGPTLIVTEGEPSR